jgi:hypothetical protein
MRRSIVVEKTYIGMYTVLFKNFLAGIRHALTDLPLLQVRR